MADKKNPQFVSYRRDDKPAVILEIYIPYKIEFLSALFSSLQQQLEAHEYAPLFKGFSLYEVKGAFCSTQPDQPAYQELTLVVRLIFSLSEYEEGLAPAREGTFVTGSVNDRLRSLADIAIDATGGTQEEIWITSVKPNAVELSRFIGQKENV